MRTKEARDFETAEPNETPASLHAFELDKMYSAIF